MSSLRPGRDERLIPMLPSRGEEPFDSQRHLFELKWAGIRALAHVDGVRLRLTSQTGRDITAWFPELAPMAGQLKRDGLVLDGEVVALSPSDEPDLGQIANRLAGGEAAGQVCLYQAFDLLYEGGRSLLDQPLIARKEALASLIRNLGPAVLTDYVPGDGLALFEAASERRLPGIVAKEKASTYTPGTVSKAWMEVPLYEMDNFVIGGYALGLKGEPAVAGLLLGEPAGSGRLRFATYLQGGFDGDLLEAVLAPFASPACPFATAPALPRLVYWLRPELMCQVKFARREADGRLRFPVFVTLRPDLSPEALPIRNAKGKSAPGK